MKKILLSLSVIVAVGAVVAGATGAFFSDTETSEGNTFTAGAIDLGIDNESYYNGELNDGTSWNLNFDLDEGCVFGEDTNGIPCLFFNFDDLKPGDYGEDTISLHVTNNEAWLCADVKLTSNDDVDCTEPENDTDAENGACNDPDTDVTDGDLAQEIDFLWWADDGDNVLETNETPLPAGKLGALGVGSTATVTLADSNGSIWPGGGPILTKDPDDILYIGKAWCFGGITPDPLPQDGETNDWSPAGNNDGVNGAGQPEDGGYNCNGVGVGNKSQTDQATLDVAFRAVQARNNDGFQCVVAPG